MQPSTRKHSVNAAATLRQGSALTLVAQAFKLFLQLGSIAVLARLVSPGDFGLISLVAPLIAFFSVFRDLGLTAATIYSDDITDAEVSSLFWMNAAGGVILALAVIAAAPLASHIYHDDRLIPLMSALALTFIFNGIGAQYQALLQRIFRFRALSAIDAGSNAIGTIIAIGAALKGAGYWALVIMPVATQLVSLLLTVSISRWHPGRPRWEGRTGMMTRFGSAVTGFNVLNYFARNVDNLLIGKFWGLEMLGYYGRAYSLMMAPLSQIIYPLAQVVVPVLTRMNRSRDEYVMTYRKLMQQIMLVTVPVVTWLIVSRYWVIELLLGERWMPVVSIFLPLGFAALVQPMNNSTGWLMLSQGRSRDVFVWGVIGSCLTVAAIVAGLPGGADGVAISYAISQIVVVTPLLWWFTCRNKFVRVQHLIASAAPFWITGAVAGGSFELMRQSLASAWQIKLSAPVGLVVSFLWVFGGSALLLLLHSWGRKLLRESIGALMSLIYRRRIS